MNAQSAWQSLLVSCLVLSAPSGLATPEEILDQKPCPSEQIGTCLELRSAIRTLWESIESQRAFGENLQQKLQLNALMERYERLVYPSAYDSSGADIARKYARLEQLLPQPESFAWRLSEDRPEIVYHPLEQEAVFKVFREFGPLELKAEDLSPSAAPQWKTLAVATPWAGYWYPRYDAILFSGRDSVLAKVDRILAQQGKTSSAQADEANLMQGPQLESWEGLCNAWSLASILTPEPMAPRNLFGESLSIAEQKGLLTKLHETFAVELYGNRYNGDFETDGTYQDLRPEALHRLLQHELGHLGRPLIIDDAADLEVWQQPIYRAEWQIVADPEQAYAYRVTARLWKIKPRWSVSNDPTGRRDFSFSDYHYRLYVEPGSLKVIAGEWLGDARRYHPDYAVLPKANGRPGSLNASLEKFRDDWLRWLLSPP